MNVGSEELTERVIECIIHVHQTLGPGFLETCYRNALLIELRKQRLGEFEKEIVVYYAGQEGGRHRLDILVEGQIILEL